MASSETQFNESLQTMWDAGISIEGMTFNIYNSSWEEILKWSDAKQQSKNVLVYDSDFGTVILKRVYGSPQ